MFNLFADLEKLGVKIFDAFKSHEAAISTVLAGAAKVATTGAAALTAAGEDPALAVELGNVASGLTATQMAIAQEASATNLIQGVTALTGLATNLVVTTDAVGVKSDASKTTIAGVLNSINQGAAVINNAIVSQAATATANAT
jgi:hypothetical protein